MISKRLQLVALLAALLHLGDGLLASASHSHAASEDHHASCGHEHGDHEHGTSESEEDSLPPDEDSPHHCAACRHLAQVATHQFALTETPSVERVSPLCCQLTRLDIGHQPGIYRSRGPPATAL